MNVGDGKHVRQWSASLRRPLVMGILNVTPDSFSDGGRYGDADDAVRRAEQMIAEGADIIDVGPESTRPGADDVDADEQMRRAVPVVERIVREHPGAVVSIDTRSADVAQRALEAGAAIVNDISAGTDDRMAAVVNHFDAAWVLMHMQGTPRTMQDNPYYEDVVREVRQSLVEKAAAAIRTGIAADRVIIDPGIGFGKTVEHNVALLADLESLVETGFAVLLGASRKRFLESLSGEPAAADRRLGGSLACAARAVDTGVHVVRVHDVSETRQFIDVYQALSKTNI